MYIKVQVLQNVPRGPRYPKVTSRSRLLGGTDAQTDKQTNRKTHTIPLLGVA